MQCLKTTYICLFVSMRRNAYSNLTVKVREVGMIALQIRLTFLCSLFFVCSDTPALIRFFKIQNAHNFLSRNSLIERLKYGLCKAASELSGE